MPVPLAWGWRRESGCIPMFSRRISLRFALVRFCRRHTINLQHFTIPFPLRRWRFKQHEPVDSVRLPFSSSGGLSESGSHRPFPRRSAECSTRFQKEPACGTIELGLPILILAGSVNERFRAFPFVGPSPIGWNWVVILAALLFGCNWVYIWVWASEPTPSGSPRRS